MATSIDEASDIVSHDGGHLGKSKLILDEHISPLSQHSGVGTANEKHALMKMIAQEMVQAFVEPEEEVENDEKVLQSRFDESIKHERMLKKAGSHRQNSVDVADLTLEDPRVVMEGSEKRRNRLKAHRWSTVEGAVPDQRKITQSPVKPVREKSTNGRQPPDFNDSLLANSTNTTSVIEDELSIEEIRRFVINNIPRAVREQIPEDAWVKIFGGAASKGGSGVSRRSLEQISNSQSESSTMPPEDRDLSVGPPEDISVISGLTGLTSAFPDGKSVESRMISMCTMEDMESKADDTSEPDVVPEKDESSRFSMGESSSAEVKAAEEAAPRGKGVVFSHVEVRYYERTGADNPAVTNGPAVGIGWNYKKGGSLSVKSWESRRGTPLKSFELIMDRAEREMILKKAGYTQKEIAEVVRTCLKGRNQRHQTVNNLHHASMEEAVESAQRRIAKIMRFGKKKSLIK